MKLSAIVSEDTRVLDVGPTSDRLARELADAGCHRYLGLVTTRAHLEHLRRSKDLADRFHPLISADQVIYNNAALLVLRAPFARTLWGLRDIRGVRHIAVERDGPQSLVETWAAQAIGRRSGRVLSRKRMSAGGDQFNVFELPVQPISRPRRHLSQVQGVRGLIRRLDEGQIRYTVLRWFETLPDLDPGEDLDILVHDDDLPRVHRILLEEPGTIPIDVYSESGQPGSDYSGISYYPPALARHIIERSERHPSGALVPTERDHLNSLAYHALYHKGATSGVPSVHVAAVPDPEHDYTSTLSDLARRQGLDFDMTMEGLDNHLARQGWQPPLDTLRRLSDSNSWIRNRFFTVDTTHPDLPELASFFVRERALKVLDLAEITAELEHLEFEILLISELDEESRSRCTRLVRGGNWGRGPYPVSGGAPVILIVALHYGPRPPGSEILRQYPRLTNSDVLLAKNELRDLVNARAGASGVFNPVHSADDEFEAWEYIKVAVPERQTDLEHAVRCRKDAYRTDVPVHRVLSLGRRAKVEIVEGPNGPVVRKTFGMHSQRHLHRELQGFQELSPFVMAIPKVIDKGEFWFSIPLYENQLTIPDRPDGRLIPLRYAREMISVMRSIHARGADLIDAKPQNFLLDPAHGIKLVDLEFYHRYEANPPGFEANYSFAGVPPRFQDDVPYGEISYEARWEPFVGLPLDSIINDPTWRQHIYRFQYRLRRLLIMPRRILRRTARYWREVFGRSREFLGDKYRGWASSRAIESFGGLARAQQAPTSRGHVTPAPAVGHTATDQ